MIDHECRVDRAGDRTLVEAVVENETTVDRRVRVENRLDGSVEPPRENGVPAPGWDDDGYTGVVPANDRLTLGYACAAPPTDPPVAVRDEGRPESEGDEEPTAADAVRLLGDHAPPADAVPTDGDVATAGGVSAPASDDPPAPAAAMVERLDEEETTNGDAAGRVAAANDERAGEDALSSTDPSGDGLDAGSPDSAEETDEPGAAPPPTAGHDTPEDLPPAVASWLADVRGRVADAETLAAGDLAAAARVVDERGGPTAAAALDETLAGDEGALRGLAAAAEALADRAADAEVPVDALQRLS